MSGGFMAVSCKQIAEMAGVSRQAAASVLNGAEKCLVSKEKKELILKLAGELNYVRNNAARTLVRGKSGLVGILSGGFHVKRTGLFIINMDKMLRDAGFLPVIIYTRSECPSIVNGIRSLLQQNVDALIINGLFPDKKGNTISTLKNQGLLDMVPTLLTNSGHRAECDTVYFNYEKVIEQVCTKAAKSSFKSVKSFIRRSENFAGTYEAGIAIQQIVKNLNIADSQEIAIYSSQPHSASDYKTDILSEVHKSMQNIVPGTLYLCDTGFCAIQVTALLLKKHGKFPADSAVIAFDHTENCGYFSPGISSVELNFDSFTQKCWELLKCRMDHPDIPVQTADIQADFIERETF